MTLFTICGSPDCPEYVHAVFVAVYLKKCLPNFKYQKIEKDNDKWKELLIKLNSENNWHVTNIPTIYKQLSNWGGKKYLLGGLSEFWEYCYCYYGLESVIPRYQLDSLVADNLAFFNDKLKQENVECSEIITIMGASNIMTMQLVNDLLDYFYSKPTRARNFIRLHDHKYADCREYLQEIVDHFNEFYNDEIVCIIELERDAIKNCDILIHLDDFSQGLSEDKHDWLRKVFLKMTYLGDWINIYSKRSLKVILCNNGPVCFMGTCLIEFCTGLRLSNIVGISASEALSALSVISELTNIPVAKMSAPPVWGFYGINQYVDDENIVYKAEVYRPYQRALAASGKSTLPLGTVESELRLLGSAVSELHTQIAEKVKIRKKNVEILLHRKPYQATCRALMSFMRLWFADEPHRRQDDSIISLCICSDGSFNIPPGIMYSQPVMLDETGKWKPFTEFPLINEHTEFQNSSLVKEMKLLLKEYFPRIEEQ